MFSDPILRALTVLLDPAAQFSPGAWSVFSGWPGRPAVEETLSSGQRVILSFHRSSLPALGRALLGLRGTRTGVQYRTVLYLNGGLLSSLFFRSCGSAYRVLAQRQFPSARQWRSRLKAKLPLMLRAERVFIEISMDRGGTGPDSDAALLGLDFLLYSNIAGKLLLTRGENLVKQQGEVVKTTLDPDYAQIMSREYETMARIGALGGRKGLLPALHGRQCANGRIFFREEYVPGYSLHQALRAVSTQHRPEEALHYLGLVDAWFCEYRALFSGEPVCLMEIYQPLFEDYFAQYAECPDLLALGKAAQMELTALASRHPGLTPIIAHNDLWPGNFLLDGDGVIAIDWERAVTGRAELFDYFWLILSTCMVYQLGRQGGGYGWAFRAVLTGVDPMSRKGRALLLQRIEALGFSRIEFRLFCTLFLMEWSLQGWRVLERQTDMDRIAVAELKNFPGLSLGFIEEVSQ